jgi:hypothetical protein
MINAAAMMISLFMALISYPRLSYARSMPKSSPVDRRGKGRICPD